ncbi:MAG: di-trans,poly-cis-decaprenylcistransferase [Clostridiaceae bacterium]|jgi:undecaprenyl diphosphate synthase|nr:di-trans,poly-cis-decaprenylcistransferase [Clostridiaceae bacterium]
MNNTCKHIGFIMDGNGRWAQMRGKPRLYGHREGVKAMKRVVSACADAGVECVSVFAFSTENWKRSKTEVDGLFKLVREFASGKLKDVRLFYTGDIAALPEPVREAVCESRLKTQGNGGIILNIALNYGGQDEIVSACKRLAEARPREFTKAEFEKYLYSAKLPPLDCIVRTGGERRLSNFMLYQAAYAELMFLDMLWPDMDAERVSEILADFNGRNRKFGAVR